MTPLRVRKTGLGESLSLWGPWPYAGSPEGSPQVVRLPASLTALLVGCVTLGHGFAL